MLGFRCCQILCDKTSVKESGNCCVQDTFTFGHAKICQHTLCDYFTLCFEGKQENTRLWSYIYIYIYIEL